MKRLSYSKKVDKLIQQGMSLREIRKRIKNNRKGQLLRIQNIIVGLVSVSVSFVIFLFASPLIKELVSNAGINDPVVRFFATAIPFVILLLLVILIVMAFRGDYGEI